MTMVFVSYSHEDREFVLRLTADLQQYNVPIWFDQQNILPGMAWDTTLEKALEESTHVLFVMSKNSIQSPIVRDEINFALDEGKPIVPILIDDCKPPLRIRRIQYTDFKNLYDDALKQLLKVLKDESDIFATIEMNESVKVVNQVELPENNARKVTTVRAFYENPYSRIVFVLSGLLRGESWELLKDETIIGRDTQCDIILPEEFISRQHVRLYREGDNYFISDLQSKNGTWINGQRLEGTQQLNDDDIIDLSKGVRLIFSSHYYINKPTPPIRNEGVVDSRGKDKILRFYSVSNQVYVGDALVQPPLSSEQYVFLRLLFENKGNICTRDAIATAVWPDSTRGGIL